MQFLSKIKIYIIKFHSIDLTSFCHCIFFVISRSLKKLERLQRYNKSLLAPRRVNKEYSKSVQEIKAYKPKSLNLKIIKYL